MAKNDMGRNFSSLSKKDLVDICDRYHIGEHLTPTLPQAKQTIDNPPPEMVGVYVYFFSKANLRLPLSDFFVHILQTYKVNISQLSPNGVLKIVFFEILCNALKITPTAGLFSFFLRLERNGDWFTFGARRGSDTIMTDFKDSIKKWKTKFFFVKKSIVSIPMEWRNGPVTDLKPTSGAYNVCDKDTLSKYTIPVKVLSNEILLMAGVGHHCDGVEKNMTLCQEDGRGADLLQLLGIQIKSEPASSHSKDVERVNKPDVVVDPETPYTSSQIVFSKKDLDSRSGESKFFSLLKEPEPILLSASSSGGSAADFLGTCSTFEEQLTFELKGKDAEMRCEKQAEPECIKLGSFVAKEYEEPVDVNPSKSEVIPSIYVTGPSGEKCSSSRTPMFFDDPCQLRDFLDAEIQMELGGGDLFESLDFQQMDHALFTLMRNIVEVGKRVTAKCCSIKELVIECDSLRESNKDLKEKADSLRAQLEKASHSHHELLVQNTNLRNELANLQNALLDAHNARYSCNKKVGEVSALDLEITELKIKGLEDKAKEENLLSQIKAIKTKTEDSMAKQNELLKLLQDMIFYEHLKCEERIQRLSDQIKACDSARKVSEEERLALVEDCSWLIQYGFQIFVNRLFNSHEFASSIAPAINAAVQLGYEQGRMTMVDQCVHVNSSIELPRYDVLAHDIHNAYVRFCEQEWEYLKALALLHDQPLEDLKNFFPEKAPTKE